MSFQNWILFGKLSLKIISAFRLFHIKDLSSTPIFADPTCLYQTFVDVYQRKKGKYIASKRSLNGLLIFGLKLRMTRMRCNVTSILPPWLSRIKQKHTTNKFKKSNTTIPSSFSTSNTTLTSDILPIRWVLSLHHLKLSNKPQFPLLSHHLMSVTHL